MSDSTEIRMLLLQRIRECSFWAGRDLSDVDASQIQDAFDDMRIALDRAYDRIVSDQVRAAQAAHRFKRIQELVQWGS